MQRFKSTIGYTIAVFGIVVAVLGPIVWFGLFERIAASSGLRIDPTYTGGSPAQTIHRASQGGAYDVVVYHPVPRRAPFGAGPFVQVVFKPVANLPRSIRESVALPGSAQPDLVAAFDCPADAGAPLHLDVTPLSPRVLPLKNVGRDDFTRLIARVGDTVVVRVPLR